MSGTVSIPDQTETTYISWDNGTVKLLDADGSVAKSQTINRYSGAYTIGDVAAGTYTLTFEGSMVGTNYLYEEANVTVGTDNVTKDFTAAVDPRTTIQVYASPDFNAYPVEYVKSGTVTFKEKDAEGEGTTVNIETYGDWMSTSYYATCKLDNSKSYTITVKATGFQDASEDRAANTQSTVHKITMTPLYVTLTGSVKMGTTELTALPEGMTLALSINYKQTPITVTTDGYKLENVRLGDATISVEPSSTYGVTTPANGRFTIEDNENHTVTQDIVISKTAAIVYVKTKPEDNIYANELTLTKEGGYPITGSTKTEDGKIVFNGVQAGTYTLGLDRFGAKLQGTAPTVTVGEDCADETIETIAIEANPETVTISGVAKYEDKPNSSDIFLNGATVKLYYSAGNEKLGDLVETKTTGSDGTFSFSQTLTEAKSYFVTIEHSDILPFQSSEINFSSYSKTSTVYFNPSVIWISGEITNLSDMEGQSELIVRLIKTENGEEKEMDQNNIESPQYTYTYFALSYDQDKGKYCVYGDAAAPVANAKLRLKLTGQDINGFLMTATEDVTLTSTAVTKNLTAVKDENAGYMTVRLRYESVEGKTLPVAQTSIYLYVNGESDYIAYASTDNAGNAKFKVTKDKTYKLEMSSASSYGYQNKTVEDVPAFFIRQGVLRPTDTTIYLQGAEPKLITYSGEINTAVWANTTIGNDMKLALQTQRDKVVMYANIVNGTYEFKDVPVVNSDNMNVFLYDPNSTKYDASYDSRVPYNYSVSPNYISGYPSQTSPVTYNNFTVVKIGCNVSGTVSPAKSGEVTLTEAGETTPSHFAQIDLQGAYIFQGVPAGTYTLTVKCEGYETFTQNVTVAAALDNVTVPAITLEAVMMTVTVSGNLGATNPNNGDYVTFDGAKLAIWNSDKTQKLVETTVPEKDNWGDIPSGFTFNAMIDTKVIFTMEHPSIKPVSKEYTVSGTRLTISPSDLGYEFTDNTPSRNVTMTNFKAEWNATSDSLKLSWTWPEGADHIIRKISMSRKLTDKTGEGDHVITWDATTGAYDEENETYDKTTTFAADELPVAYTDTVSRPLDYTYIFNIMYSDDNRKQFIGRADMRVGERYKLTYTVNDDKMGTLTSYGQPEGEYMEGDLITLTAKAKEGYKFVEFLKNDKKLSDAERAKLILYSDTSAIYGFNMPAEDLTVKAVFASRNPEKKEYTVKVESSNKDWGTVSGGGKFEEGKEIEVKATVTDEVKYAFVAWKDGDKVVSTKAIHNFKVEKDITLTAVFDVHKYVLSLAVNEAEWGSVEGEGEFAFGTEVTATAKPNEGYKFVAWMEINGENETKVWDKAVYKFNIEKDVMLKAIFEKITANEKLEAAKWSIHAENGAIVIKGINGDRYDIYDLNGRLCGAALCTGAEIRLNVATSKLYIVRRLGADGSFDAKKIVVR